MRNNSLSILGTFLFGTTAIASMAMAGCGANSEPTIALREARSELRRETSPQVDDAAFNELVRENNAFGLDLYKRLAMKADADNLFFSAHSLSSAFAMLQGGARGETEREIAKTLHFTLPQEKLHPAVNRLALELASRARDGGSGSDGKGFRLNMHNSFWGQQTTTWEKPYLDLLAVNYGAGINLVDFMKAPEPARNTINAWTEEKTEKRIKELLPSGSIDESTQFVLVNTVYFNAAWANAFQATNITFNAAVGTPADVSAIRSADAYGYAASGDAVAVSIPYEDKKLELVLVLPSSISAYESGIDSKLNGLLDALEPTEVDVTLPKFTIKGRTISLREELSAMGMKTAFETADLAGIAKEGLALADVHHQAFVKVNEKGTEAAAATAIEGFIVGHVAPSKVVRIDHPFLFFIRDLPTKAILFSGRVTKPEYSE